MVRIWEEVKSREATESVGDAFQQGEICEFIAIALQKQHRDLDLEKMLCPLFRRPARRVQRKTQEYQAADAR